MPDFEIILATCACTDKPPQPRISEAIIIFWLNGAKESLTKFVPLVISKIPDDIGVERLNAKFIKNKMDLIPAEIN